MWYGNITCALSLIFKFFVLYPFSLTVFISSINTFGSITTPFPITAKVFSFNIPDGIRWNANFLPFTSIECPALFPPVHLTEISAFCDK